MASGPTILIVGPASAVGGISTAVRTQLRSPLCDAFNLVCLDNSKRTSVQRPWWRGVFSQLHLGSRLLGMLWRHRPGVVHIHTCSGVSFFRSIADYVSARLFGARVIMHIHGGRFDAFLSGLSRISGFVVRRVLRGSDRVLALSESWAARLNRFDESIPVSVVPNAVALPAPRSAGDGGATVTVLFVGLLTVAKGVDDLIAAVNRLPTAARDRIRVRLVGGDPHGRAALVHERVESAGLQDIFEFVGQISPDEVSGELDRADIFVLPSHAEGQPISLLEAMARAIPCVASNVGAVAETLADGIEGLIIAPGDVAALGDALAHLIDDRESRCRLGYAARRRIAEQFSDCAMADILGRVYRDTLAEGKR